MTATFSEHQPAFHYFDQMRPWVVFVDPEAGSIEAEQLPSFCLGGALQEAATA